jgi:N-acyl-D-aspartate/D-glutamate deacylase
VRERGVLPLEEAVRRLTSHPASIFGIRRRGALLPGYYADLLLFDPATVQRGPKQRIFDLPDGQPRLTTPAIGVQGVWVNGVRLSGDALAGRLLREFSP